MKRIAFRRPPPEWGQYYLLQWDLRTGKHVTSSAQLSPESKKARKFYDRFYEITGEHVSEARTSQSVVCFKDLIIAKKTFDALVECGGHGTLHRAETIETNQEAEEAD